MNDAGPSYAQVRAAGYLTSVGDRRLGAARRLRLLDGRELAENLKLAFGETTMQWLLAVLVVATINTHRNCKVADRELVGIAPC